MYGLVCIIERRCPMTVCWLVVYNPCCMKRSLPDPRRIIGHHSHFPGSHSWTTMRAVISGPLASHVDGYPAASDWVRLRAETLRPPCARRLKCVRRTLISDGVRLRVLRHPLHHCSYYHGVLRTTPYVPTHHNPQAASLPSEGKKTPFSTSSGHVEMPISRVYTNEYTILMGGLQSAYRGRKRAEPRARQCNEADTQ